MLEPCTGTLKHLRFSTCFAAEWGHTDPLFGLSNELAKILRMDFAVETITMEIGFHHTSTLSHRNPKTWHKLDTVLTALAKWTTLEAVSLMLHYDTFGGPEDLVMETFISDLDFRKVSKRLGANFSIGTRHVPRDDSDLGFDNA
ncbi:hypothetical protein BDN70DRAFT_131851 [Pholiota conissans]|uniref:Uncharacterized protein n=1 Tax=Pholiota conissans TaxID=109636 RepID=A0A9P5YX39_9AGAR|nr:hypothetical protein BDN70DRAFT_131851 [Pholiota conissans]